MKVIKDMRRTCASIFTALHPHPLGQIMVARVLFAAMGLGTTSLLSRGRRVVGKSSANCGGRSRGYVDPLPHYLKNPHTYMRARMPIHARDFAGSTGSKVVSLSIYLKDKDKKNVAGTTSGTTRLFGKVVTWAKPLISQGINKITGRNHG
jgi:hypothetical protein